MITGIMNMNYKQIKHSKMGILNLIFENIGKVCLLIGVSTIAISIIISAIKDK